MPVIDVLANRSYPKARVRKAIAAACREVAKAVGIKPGQVWVRFQPGRAEDYWEGDGKAIERRAVPLLVFVHMAKGRPPEKLRAVMKGVTVALAGELDIAPDAVWVRLMELDLTHVAQGGVTYAELRA